MLRFHVPDMTCGGCLKAVTRSIQKVDPQALVEGTLGTREIAVTSDKSETALLSALAEAGYPAQALRPAAE